jgi:hypothetical protein
MRQWRLGVAVALSSGLLVSAQQSGSVADEVLRMERAQADATLKKDRAAYERLLADDYSYIHSNGSVNNKAEEVTSTMSAEIKWTSDVLSDAKVRVYGDAAVVTAVETLQGAAKGFVAGPRRITDVWIKRGGRWQIAGGITTLVSKDTSPNGAASAVKDLKARSAAGKTAEEGAVLKADEAFARADLDKDDSKAKALQTNDYSFVSRSGALATPADAATPQHTSHVVAYDSVRASGTVAIVQGSLLWTDVNKFSPGVLRFMRVWVKDGSAWKLAAEQRTPIAAAARPKT